MIQNMGGGDGRPKYLHILHSSLLRITCWVKRKRKENKAQVTVYIDVSEYTRETNTTEHSQVV